MAIPFNDNIQLNATPSENNHVVTKGYVDTAVGNGSGGSYTLPVASSSTLGGITVNGGGLSINSTTGLLSVSGRAITTALAPAYNASTTYSRGDCFTYNDKLYRVDITSYNGVPGIGIVAGTSSVPEVSITSLISSVSSNLSGKANYAYGTISVGSQQWLTMDNGTIYWNTSTDKVYLKLSGISGEAFMFESSFTPLLIPKKSVVASTSTMYFTLEPKKTIYTASISANRTFVFGTDNLENIFTNSNVVTFEIVLTVTGSNNVTITWPDNLEWLGDATTDGEGITTLTAGRTYYFVFRSFNDPPEEWDDYESEIRWIGNLQGSISNPAS